MAAPTPRPMPVFLPESPFSQRKRTPFRAPPRSPAKSCPPVSRVFLTPRNNVGPQLVSFKSERKPAEVSISSPVYNAEIQKSYFEQCFEVITKLGEGSFGEVYKVRSHEDGRLYAVKRSRQRFRGEHDRRLKLAEVEKHERLPPHPNCVRFLKAWEEKQHLYIQTELCLMSLTEYADIHGRVPEHRVWQFMVDLIRGLKHLHDHHLCHLDIKPANIFISRDGSTCMLGDFGLCVSTDEQGLTDAIEGDAKYMAPELMQGRFGQPADIFSLGISLLEVACDLELPSGGSNWHLLREGCLPGEFTKDMSVGLVTLLGRMLQPDPAARPTVNDLITSVRWTAFKYSMIRLCSRMASLVSCVCRSVYACVLAILSVLAVVCTAVKRSPLDKSSDRTKSETVDPPPPFNRVEDSFSDDDEDSSHSIHPVQDAQQTLNRSWLHHSPVKYPSPVYSGPPIPLDFSESSFERSSADSVLNPSPLTGCLPSADHSFSSINSSFSCTPSAKPSFDDTKIKNLHIGPKNLMDVFSEVGD